MIKGYHKSSFAVGLGVGEKFVVKKLVNDHRLHMLIAVRFRFILKKFNYEFFTFLVASNSPELVLCTSSLDFDRKTGPPQYRYFAWIQFTNSILILKPN